MGPQTGCRLLWNLIGLLCLVCSTPVAGEQNSAGSQGKSIRMHQDVEMRVIAQSDLTKYHVLRSELKESDRADVTASEPVVDGRTLGEWLRKLESKDLDDRISACMALEEMGPSARRRSPRARWPWSPSAGWARMPLQLCLILSSH